ncbi:MAG: phosphotransferase [Candidatus Magasanikbacteria bacterium]|nr:phosphotransferase [Candidatus Magasanikbacteria bacterium]
MCCKALKPDGRKPINTLEIEFEILERAYEAGVPVPKPLAHIQDTKTGQEYMLMQAITGSTLEEYQAKARRVISKKDIAHFQTQLASMIAALHKAGIYHRDLHMGNIMRDDATGALYIIDFGQSKRIFLSEEKDSIYRHTYKKFDTTNRRFVEVHETLEDDTTILATLQSYIN